MISTDMNVLDETYLEPEFSGQGADCYRLKGRNYNNAYYIVSEAETRKLLTTPEIVGYEVYECMLKATDQMLCYLKRQGKITRANILCILRGALNYPLEECCYRQHIRVHDISFLSSERIFSDGEISGLSIKYSKVAIVPDSTLLIGDIVASGETLVHCLKHIIASYRDHHAALRNIILFTIGGAKGIEILEPFTKEIQQFWPEFEGITVVYYEGIFSTYQDQGITGVNTPDVDFCWKNGIVAPEFRQETLSSPEALFEKCIIYDGGARRYEIQDHIFEVLNYWKSIRKRSGQIDITRLIEEKLGHALMISYEEWLAVTGYSHLDPDMTGWLFDMENGFVNSLKNISLKQMADQRIEAFSDALYEYI